MFGKLIQVLVFGCGYCRIADHTCSATTLRRRRDEWITAGVAEQLRLAVLAAYDRMHGLQLEHLAVDGCPFGPTVHGGRLDTDLLITRTTMPLRVPAAALLRLVQARPPGTDSQLNIQ